MKPNKILLINDTLTNHGGAETYCFLLKDLLDKHGYKTRVIGGQSGVGLENSFFSRWYSPHYYQMTQNAIKEFEPDIIHVHNVSRVVSPSVLSASAAAGIPIIQTVHDYHYICPKLWMITDQDTIITQHDSLIECMLHHLPKKHIAYAASQYLKANIHKSLVRKYVSHFICPSRNLTQWYANIFTPSKVSYLPLFVQGNPSDVIRKPEENTLLFVGRLSKEKGVDVLLKAVQIAQKDIPSLRLLIIGDGPEKRSLLHLTEKLQLGNRVKFLNQLSHNEIGSYYQKAVASIIPSSWIENCPMVALEAINAGCPIIASKSGGLIDLVQEGTTGYLFDRNNAEMLAKKICMLVCDKQIQKRFSNNQKHVAKTLNQEMHLKELEQIYQMYL